jgi:flagellar basal-body rod modification protein FlgD
MTGINGLRGSSDQQIQAMAQASQGAVNKNDFLKLLMAQLRNQSPLQPMEEKDFMAQMAQFSTLEQVTKVAENMQAMTFSNQIGQGVGLIGHTVDYKLADGTKGQGEVASLTMEADGFVLDVGGVTVKPAEITKVLK